jgi:exonuclease SbcD
MHLGTGTEDASLTSVKHMADYMEANDLKTAIFAGDWFHSRSFQRQEVLISTLRMLNYLQMKGITVHIFPGNHDKTLYGSQDSFLDMIKHHPAVKYYSIISDINVGGLKITLLPFFSDDLLVPMIQGHPGSDILISHFEMQGSTNLGHVSEKNNITRRLLKKWDKTYLGHYHNWHEITPDIVHLPSLRQQSFGEDPNKGFSVLYDDGSYEIVKGKFKEFLKIVININDTNTREIKELIKTHENSVNTIRFEFIGDDSKLKAIDKSLFKGTGIDVAIKFAEKFDPSQPEPLVIEKFDEQAVTDAFKEFCIDKGLDHEIGFKFLKEFLENK